MIRGVLRSIAIALAVVAIGGVAKAIAISAFCPWRAEWTRRYTKPDAAVLDSGTTVARPGDALFLCDTPHVTGPIVWHTDTHCLCAPAELTPAAIALRVGGSCVVDNPHPSIADTIGRCQRARCDEHIDP